MYQTLYKMYPYPIVRTKKPAPAGYRFLSPRTTSISSIVPLVPSEKMSIPGRNDRQRASTSKGIVFPSRGPECPIARDVNERTGRQRIDQQRQLVPRQCRIVLTPKAYQPCKTRQIPLQGNVTYLAHLIELAPKRGNDFPEPYFPEAFPLVLERRLTCSFGYGYR